MAADSGQTTSGTGGEAPQLDDRIDLVAAVLAFVVPGLGHVYGGRPRRGVLIAVGVFGMVFGGVLIGGIDVIDQKEDRWWFYGQAAAGPLVLGINHYNQTRTKGWVVERIPAQGNRGAAERGVRRSPGPGETIEIGDLVIAGETRLTGVPMVVEIPEGAGSGARPPKSVSLGKVNEIGTLYVLCGGTLNLIAILDAFMPRHPRRRRKGTSS